ncbi:hypothetical protein BDV32DRAFT_147360 [Aspergillus pseudonomiae]|uniref:Uncharacterized protein n=1 Tax=Aspergillus pseudonomiae TaxID=1506151 RepID=A0A5N6I6X6_9EURO|nr:uncharacterized protein BDV37DRAFT_284307 [Aspergillus pseudonomiae]KAB8262432.1 hypothetical protein BDV32DRAFT_147360 [Aspergillus pseudonomiae]KAE8402808.1 hypothetical protein BDV37DRAFT_284307 [Aspergillus pseudonomiae]
MARDSTLSMALSFTFFAICLFQVQATGVEPGPSKPAFLSVGPEKLREVHSKLKLGATLDGPKFPEVEFNDDIYWDGKFGSTSSFRKEYPFDIWEDGVDDSENEYNNVHPNLHASRLPGIGSSKDIYPYIASISPAKYGRSQKFMYWDMVWNQAEKETNGDIILVDLAQYVQGLAAEEQEDLIPSVTTKSLSFTPPEKKETKQIIPPYRGIYSVHYKGSNAKWAHSDIEYRQISLEYHDDSKKPAGTGPHNLHYFRISSWKDRQAIDPEKLQFLIDEVDKKFKGQTIIVNCLLGFGRTGSFIEAREMYRETVKAKSTKWFFSSSGDPIEEYTATLRKRRALMIDSARQYEFLHAWAARMWTMTTEGNTKTAASSAGNPPSQGRRPPTS